MFSICVCVYTNFVSVATVGSSVGTWCAAVGTAVGIALGTATGLTLGEDEGFAETGALVGGTDTAVTE